ncbi:MAG: hypothetical protein LBL90_06460 [Prevotellaceae bacterium]|jgi:hypothetical protein|nr:hypothetical protein [Prevotellaceae bacterium]
MAIQNLQTTFVYSVVLCHILFPEARHLDYYMLFKNKDDGTEYMYINNQLYNIATNVIRQKLTGKELSDECLFAILVHSSTFSIINRLLSDNQRLEDCDLSPCVFYNPE